MPGKARHFDYRPDEYIVGVSRMSFEQQGLYWMICSLVMSHGGPIPNDPKWIGKLGDIGPAKCRNIIQSLIAAGKITENDSKISQKRAEIEVKHAQKRIETAQENGKKGGRPSSKNNDLENPSGLSAEKLTTNESTTNLKKERDIPPGGGGAVNGKYRWAGEVIRLNEKDFNRWQESFGAIDLPCQLASLDAYLASDGAKPNERKRWFQFTAGALKNRNEDARSKERFAQRHSGERAPMPGEW